MCRRTHSNLSPPSRGVTLFEMLIAVSIMSMMALAVATLASAVHTGVRHSQGVGTATQHARVVIERIERAVNNCTASEQFPGCIAFAEYVGTHRFPDTLVVWYPSGTAASPDALPRFSELVVFCPDPSNPSQLLEITNRTDTRTVPAITDSSSWATELSSLKSSNTAKKTVLTTLMRSASANSTSSGNTSNIRGCVRFDVEYHPTLAELAAYRGGSPTDDNWKAVPWAQGIYGTSRGLRQSWCQFEIQIMPYSASAGETETGEAIPFFGSAARYYLISR